MIEFECKMWELYQSHYGKRVYFNKYKNCFWVHLVHSYTVRVNCEVYTGNIFCLADDIRLRQKDNFIIH